MGQPWAKEPFGPVLKGLLDRWQERVEDSLFAREATNVDFYGGVVGKRGGTQLLNGWGSYTRQAAIGGVGNPIPMVDTGPGGVLPTADGGFKQGDLVTIQIGDAAPIDGTIGTVDHTAHTIELLEAIDPIPVGSFIIVRRAIPGNPAVRGIFPVSFRDGEQRLIVAAGGKWWRITASDSPEEVLERYGVFTIAFWAGDVGQVSVPGTGEVFTLQGAKVGDFAVIPGAGPGGTTLVTTIASFIFDHVGFPAVTFSPAPTEHPSPVVVTILLATPDPSVEQYGVMFANVLHLSSAGIPSIPLFFAPRKYEQVPQAIHRHGIIGPRKYGLAGAPAVFSGLNVLGTVADPGPYQEGDPGPQPGFYVWRWTYGNSRTGQESLAGAFPVAGEFSVSGGVNVGPGVYVHLSVPTSIDPQVDQIVIYRSDPPAASEAVGGDYYYVTTLVNDPTVVTTVDFFDTLRPINGHRLLREGLDLPALDEVEQFIPWPHTNRLIAIVQRKATQPGFVAYSGAPDLETGYLKGESFRTNDRVYVNHDDGDVYTAVSAFFDSVVIFKRRSVWRMSGFPPDTLVIQPVSFQNNQTGIGCIGAKMVVQDHDDLLFPHDDGYYQLSRFDGQQSGFQAQRLSLPIDERWVVDVEAETATSRGHAAFYRPGRQIRCWANPGACLVFTLDGPVTGEAMGWARWVVNEARPDVAAAITASATGPSARLIIANWDATTDLNPPTIHYLGTDDGLILQMDTGTADYGGVSYPVTYETVDFAPVGKGVASRGRALDLQVAAFEKAVLDLGATTTIGLRITTDQLTTPIDIDLTVVGSFSLLNKALVSPFHLLQTAPITVEEVGALLIAPGQFHRMRFSEEALDTMWRIQGWAYWQQAITITQITRRHLQASLERLR